LRCGDWQHEVEVRATHGTRLHFRLVLAVNARIGAAPFGRFGRHGFGLAVS